MSFILEKLDAWVIWSLHWGVSGERLPGDSFSPLSLTLIMALGLGLVWRDWLPDFLLACFWVWSRFNRREHVAGRGGGRYGVSEYLRVSWLILHLAG